MPFYDECVFYEALFFFLCSVVRKKVYVEMNHGVQQTKYLLRLSDRLQRQKTTFLPLKKSVRENMR